MVPALQRLKDGNPQEARRTDTRSLDKLLADISACVAEFNRVDALHKLGRVARAAEFKERFADFNARLSSVVADLSFSVTVDTAADARNLAQAEQRDAAFVASVVCAENKRLADFLANSGAGHAAALQATIQASAKAEREALESLRVTSAAQAQQLKEVRGAQAAGFAALAAKLDALAAAAAAGQQAPPAPFGAPDAREALAQQHAALCAELGVVLSGAAADKAVASAVSAAMAESGRELTASIEAGRKAQEATLRAVVAAGRSEAADAARELLRNLGDLRKLQAVQIELAAELAGDVRAVKVVVTETRDDVKTLLSAVDALTTKLDAVLLSSSSRPCAVVDAQVDVIVKGGVPGRELNRLLAYAQANAAADGFSIHVTLAGVSLSRGITATPVVEVARAVIGRPVVLEVVASHDCYFYMIEQDSAGGLSPLVPFNVGQSGRVDNRLSARVVRVVPDKSRGDRFELTFSDPPGWEHVFVFATRTPWSEWDQLVCSGAEEVREHLARGVVSRGAASRGITATPSRDADAAVAACVHIFELFER